jgi:spore maturation protein CgeB
MRILVLNADYPRFLGWFYRRQPGLENTSYAAQMAARNASLFGVADFYSRNFTALGHQAAEIHVNNPWLQSAWAHEHGMAFENPEPPGGAGCPAGAHPILRGYASPRLFAEKRRYR